MPFPWNFYCDIYKNAVPLYDIDQYKDYEASLAWAEGVTTQSTLQEKRLLEKISLGLRWFSWLADTRWWWELLPGVFISQLNREAAVWANRPDRHADGIEAVTHSRHCQNQVAAAIRSQVCVEDETRGLFYLFIFEEGYPKFSSWWLGKASIMRLNAALLRVFLMESRPCEPRASAFTSIKRQDG